MATFPGHGCETGSAAEIEAMRAAWTLREAERLKHDRKAEPVPFETLKVWTAIYQSLLRSVRGQSKPY